MERTMTIGDFVTEAALFDISKENFEFVKECGELQLMEIYAESVDYVTENAEELSDNELGMLVTEAAASKEGIGDKIKGKAKKLWDWIVRLCKKVASAIASFFGKLTRVFPKKRTEKIARLETACSNITEALAKAKKKDEKAPIVDAINSAISSVLAANEQNKEAAGEVAAAFTCSRYPNVAKFLKAVAGLDGVDKDQARRAIGIMISSIDDEVTVSIPEMTVVNEEMTEMVVKAFNKLGIKKDQARPSERVVKSVVAEAKEGIAKINRAKVKFVKTKVNMSDEALTAKANEMQEMEATIKKYLKEIEEAIQKAKIGGVSNDSEALKKMEGETEYKHEETATKKGIKNQTTFTSTNQYSIVLATLRDLITLWQTSVASTINTYNNLQKVVMTNVDAIETLVNAVQKA